MLFFDSDCISAFLWVKGQNLITQLYSKKIVIPKQSYNEISAVPHLKKAINTMIVNEDAIIYDMLTDTAEYQLYVDLITGAEGHKAIGDGEAACIALAKEKNGIIASNNLKDIDYLVSSFSLNHITTGGILVEAYEKGMITENEGNKIWADMLNKRRKIGANSFSEYLEKVKSST